MPCNDVIEITKGEFTDTITEGTKTIHLDPGMAQATLIKRGYTLAREGVNPAGLPVQVWEKRPTKASPAPK